MTARRAFDSSAFPDAAPAAVVTQDLWRQEKRFPRPCGRGGLTSFSSSCPCQPPPARCGGGRPVPCARRAAAREAARSASPAGPPAPAPRPLLWPRGRAGPARAEGGSDPATAACLSQHSKLGSAPHNVCFSPFILFFLTPFLLGNLSACHIAKGLAVLSVSQNIPCSSGGV